jgi:foldase protein PrsA
VKSAKRVIAALVSFLIMIGFAGCGLVSRTPEGEKKVVVAKGTDIKITKGDFEKRFALQSVLLELYYGDDFLTNKDYASQVTQIKSQILDDMVQETVIVNKAKELKLVPDDATLNKEAQAKLDEFMSGEADQTKFKKKMEDKKVTMDDFKELFKRLAISDKVYESLVKDISVTDADAQQYYNENLYDYTEKPNIMNVSHILVATEAEAASIKDKLAKGEKFEDLAKQYSTDTGSKDKGGLLGDIAYNDKNYVAEFMTGALATPEGKISAPVKSQFGYHIIRVNKKTEYPQKKFETVKEEIKKTVLESKKSEKYQTSVTEWETNSKVTKYADKL